MSVITQGPSYRWNIKITQLKCDQVAKLPSEVKCGIGNINGLSGKVSIYVISTLTLPIYKSEPACLNFSLILFTLPKKLSFTTGGGFERSLMGTKRKLRRRKLRKSRKTRSSTTRKTKLSKIPPVIRSAHL